MPRKKIKFAMRIKPETQELVREWYSKDNCQSQNEFIEKAIHFYVEHLSAQSSTSFLPSALVSALRATIQASENRIARLLFNTVDLVEFLRYKGEPLIRSGSEFRMSSNHSVTVGGNEWYDHAAEKGGGPVSFLKEFYGMNYQQDWNEDLCANFEQAMEDQQHEQSVS